MKRAIIPLTLIITLIASIILIATNSHSIEFDYILGKTTAPLIILLVVTLILGIVIGFIANFVYLHRLRKKIKKLEKAAAVTEKELSNLRNMPFKDFT